MKKILLPVFVTLIALSRSAGQACDGFIARGGPSDICIGSTAGYWEIYPTQEGTWSSSDTTVATASEGFYYPWGSYATTVYGVAPGSAQIIFTALDGCVYTDPVIVHPQPEAIVGPDMLCAGTSFTYTNPTVADPPGRWKFLSSAWGGDFNFTTGELTATGNGSATLYWGWEPSVWGGCVAIKSVTLVDTPHTPDPITGVPELCVGETNYLVPSGPESPGAFTWTSSDPGIATVEGAGMVTGISPGTAIMTATVSNECGTASGSIPVTVGPAAVTIYETSPPPHIDNAEIYASNGGSGTIYFQGTTSGGTSTDLGGTPQTVTESGTYYFRAMGAGGCWGAEGSITITIGEPDCEGVVSPGGPNGICVGGNSTLWAVYPAQEGTWSSSDTTVATVTEVSYPWDGAMMHGVGPGRAEIRFTTPAGCVFSDSIFVHPQPEPIVGPDMLCAGTSFTYTNPTIADPPGQWKSLSSVWGGNFNFSTGELTALGNGSATLYWGWENVGGGCLAMKAVTLVDTPHTPEPITGVTDVCVGETTYLTPSGPESPGAFTWTSSNPDVATVEGAGMVTGISPGTAIMTATASNECGTASGSIPVNVGQPAPVTAYETSPSPHCGNAEIYGSNGGSGTIYFQGTTSGGTSTDLGGTPQTVTVSGTYYFRAKGAGDCWGAEGSITVTIGSSLEAISGPDVVCVGADITLSCSPTGGSWSSTVPAVGTVSAAGVVTGVGSGSTTISYVSGGCSSSKVVMVNPKPATPFLNNTTHNCDATVLTVSNGGSGTIWFQGTNPNGTATTTNVTTSPNVTVTTAATYYFRAQSSAGCWGDALAVPATILHLEAIAGPDAVCVDANITLTNSTAGGSWSSSAPAIGSISSGGVVTGIAAGSPVISYTVESCTVTKYIMVNPKPATPFLNNTTHNCDATVLTVSNGGDGTIWFQGTNPNGTATTTNVTTSPNVTVTTAATYYFRAQSSAGCWGDALAVPATILHLEAIAGPDAVCVDANITLTNSTAGGSWSSSAPAIGSISSGGVVTGIAAGSPVISYTVESCTVTKYIMVNPKPATPFLNNTTHNCDATVLTVSNGGDGTIWFQGTNPNGTATTTNVTTSPNVTVTTAATYYFRAQSSAGCWGDALAVPVTILSVATVNGPDAVCVGSDVTLACETAGGVWSSSAPAIGSISSSGVVTGIAAGSPVISYTVESCTVTKYIMVNPKPATPFLNNTTHNCDATVLTVSNGGSGTIWFQGTNPNGTATTTNVTTSPNVTVTTAATYYFRAQSSAGCWGDALAVPVTILSVATVNGPDAVCVGSDVTLTCETAGGVWSSSAPAIGSVSASGVVTGLAAGSTVISYTLESCTATKNIMVNPKPATPFLNNTTHNCDATVLTVSNGGDGTIWFQGTNPNGTATTTNVTTSLNVTVTTAGTYYFRAQSGAGCWGDALAVPVTITHVEAVGGSDEVCVGSNITLTCETTGGAWSSSAPVIGTVSTGGVVTGIAAGSTVISYTIQECTMTKNVVVNPKPATPFVNNTAHNCDATVLTVSNGGDGTIWFQGTNPNGTATTTNVTTSPNVTMTTAATYYFRAQSAAGCWGDVLAVPVTIQHVNAINGADVVCVGSTIALTNTTPGGTWSSSAPAIGSVSTNGVVAGIAAGSTTISYTVQQCTITKDITVVNGVSPITGPGAVCVGKTIQLSNETAGGLWSSSSPATATVSSAGLVTGIVAGTTRITYAIGACRATTLVTVNALPTGLTGTATVCEGSSVTLSGTPAGGSWSISNGNATIGTTGVVTGVVAGTSTITYTNAAGCQRTIIFTVTPSPAAITGNDGAMCTGTTKQLANSVPNGTWSSSTPSVASIGSAGLVSAITAGTARMTYSISGCRAFTIVTSNATPTSITGPATVCEGATITLSGSPAGGSWSSSNGNATIGTNGVVTGVAMGTSTITYTNAAGCYRTTVVTVNKAPGPIDGNDGPKCPGHTRHLSNSVPGGMWSSSNSTVSPITTDGTATCNGTGSATITYTLGSCRTSTTVSVHGMPANLNGPNSPICEGGTISFIGAPGGGSWSSSNANVTVGTVSTVSGIVTGITAGTSVVTYANASGCYRTVVVTVNIAPAGISGNTGPMCAGTTRQLSNSVPGGTWSSSSTGVASVGSAGMVTAVAAGTAKITYAIGSCRTITIVTVNALPTNIAGTMSMCEGTSVTLTGSPAGGSWSGGNSSAVVGTGSSVSGVLAGTATITYTLATGCYRTAVVSVNTSPAALTGNTGPMCAGATKQLLDAVSGGTWSSSATGVATVSSDGLVTAGTAGTAKITYAIGACRTLTIVTVNALPTNITGNMFVCEYATTTLTASPAGGTWSSSNGSATAATGGVITGVTAGTSTITYTNAAGCYRTTVMTVNTAPTAITGNIGASCAGTTTQLADPVPGGTWSSSASNVAAVGSTGLVTNAAAGTAKITYAIGACRAFTTMTVNALPTSIGGSLSMCTGTSVTLGGSPSGGSWSSSNGYATIGSTGVVTGITAGTSTITYTNAAGCYRTTIVTMNQSPAAITGNMTNNVGSTITLSNAVGGGVWSSSKPTVASINSTGVVSCLSAGSALISYTIGSCRATTWVYVVSTASGITGAAFVCAGSSVTLTGYPAGGSWSSGSGNATVNSTGVVTGVSAGTAVITYYASPTVYTKVMTINALPNAGTISGSTTVTQASNITLTTTGSGGVWSSNATNIATVSSAGVVTGVNTGSVTISYTVTSGCGVVRATYSVTVISGAGRSTSDLSSETESAAVNIYPNPTEGYVTVDAPTDGTLLLYALDGRQVAQYAISKGGASITFPADLAAGMYVARYFGDDGTRSDVRLLYRGR